MITMSGTIELELLKKAADIAISAAGTGPQYNSDGLAGIIESTYKKMIELANQQQ
jgi:hypothetical protein